MKTTNITQKRFLELAKLGSFVFHTDDLARIWAISDKHNLHMTLTRYTKSELLHRIYRGLYSLQNPKDLDKYVLGAKALNEYCYLSGETILAREGIIFQSINYITFISSKNRRFELGGNNYHSRQLKDEFLHNNVGIVKEGGINIATLERAVADILYYNPHYHFDNRKGINWKRVREIQNIIGYTIH